MTAIVGLTHKGRVLLGGDSAAVSGLNLTVRADVKVFTSGPYVIGFTSSFRMGQVLRYATTLPAPPDDPDVMLAHMCTAWIDSVRKALKDAGWARKEAEQEAGGTFLVGVHGRLFEVCDDYQVGEPVDGYAAVGCGDQAALGALYATGRLGPERRARLALAAAERHSAGVRGPFTLAWEPETAQP
jgi:hypothetical protein